MIENKKTIIITAIVAVVVIIGAFMLGSWNERRIITSVIKSNPVPQVAVQNQNTVPADPSLDKAIKSNDLSQCAKLATADKQAQCKSAVAMNLASEKNDPSICSKSGLSEADTADCQNTVNFSTASSGDISSCDKITDPGTKYSCVFNAWNSKAVKDKNPAVCDNIAEQINKDLCKENVAAVK
jgi:hypothetical protein